MKKASLTRTGINEKVDTCPFLLYLRDACCLLLDLEGISCNEQIYINENITIFDGKYIDN